MSDSFNLELPVAVSDLVSSLIVVGKRYKVTYYVEVETLSEKPGRHVATGELIKIHKPKRFYEGYDNWIELKQRNGNHTIQVRDIIRIQGAVE